MLTPVNTLSEMNKSMIAGLSKNQMYEQCDALVEQLKAILDSKATPEEMHNKCRCITFDGESDFFNFWVEILYPMLIYQRNFL